MRVALVGTDLAPVVPGAGAIEQLLCGWAAQLGRDHEVCIVSVPAPAAPDDGLRRSWVPLPDGLPAALAASRPDVVLLNNRPGWQRLVGGTRALHLFHNWPDAWGVEEPAAALGGTSAGAAAVPLGSAAAVSSALASVVSSSLGGRPVGVVEPFVEPVFGTVEAAAEPGLVLAPNRLLRKKGVAELCAAAGSPALAGHRVLVTDHLSPWTSPTAEHEALRAVVARSPRCELVPAARDRGAVAELYARAAVVVVPSVRPEGFGMVAAEAQAVGVPVVSSGLGGLAESTLRPEFVADPADPAELAATIARAAAVGPAERAALRREATVRWTPERSAASLLAALEAAGSGR